MTETRTCYRGCITFEESEDGKRVPKHYASCVDFGRTEALVCRGCVPREAADGALLCVGCIGRARRLLDDAWDLLARVESTADPLKSGWNWDRHVTTGVPESADRIKADQIDASDAIRLAIRYFGGGRIDEVFNDAQEVALVGDLVLQRHKPDELGVREAWSVQDAVDRWGVESKDRHVFPGRLPNAPQGSYAAYDEQGEPMAIPELYDPFLDVKQAAARAGVTVRAVQKWVKEGRLTPVAKLRAGDGKVHTYFRASDVTTNHANGAQTPAGVVTAGPATTAAAPAGQDHLDRLMERSSFGDAEATAARESVSDEKARDLVERSKRVSQDHTDGSLR